MTFTASAAIAESSAHTESVTAWAAELCKLSKTKNFKKQNKTTKESFFGQYDL
jgi:hypothetical protein